MRDINLLRIKLSIYLLLQDYESKRYFEVVIFKQDYSK